MAKICPKHDVAYQEQGSCWCCDQEKKKAAKPSGKVVPVATGGKK